MIRLLHDMDTAWTSSNPALLQVAVDTDEMNVIQGVASNRVEAASGSFGVFADVVPPAPVDLSGFEEIRFWVQANRTAQGTARAPFFLEFSYTDTGDLPGELHRWLVPVSLRNQWDHIRLGIENDRRSAITNLRFRSVTNLPFIAWIDELIAVRERMLADVENALIAHIATGVVFDGLTALPMTANANAGTSQVTIAQTVGFFAGNQVLLRGGSAGDESKTVLSVVPAGGNTTLNLADALAGNFLAGTGTVTLTAPVFMQLPEQANPPSPAIIIDHIDAREDRERTPYTPQLDSFRLRGASTVCSTRPPARAYTTDYQIAVEAPLRPQVQSLFTHVLRRIQSDVPLRVNGFPCPVSILPAPEPERRRHTSQLAPIYMRVGTRMEMASRREQPMVASAELEAGRMDAPLDLEGIRIDI